MKISKFTIFFLLGLMAATTTAGAQVQNTASAPEPTISESFPEEEAFSDKDKIVTIAVENDSIGGGGTDQNYTSGVRLSYFDINADLPEWARSAAKPIPDFDINHTTSVYYSLGQNLYTPEDITSEVQADDDRPWAAWAYGSVGLSTLTENHNDIVEVSLGVVGPEALGKQTQEVVHELIGSPDPEGWDNQLDFEPGIVLSWERRWPQSVTADIGPLNFSAMPSAGVTLGNIYTHASAGLSFQLTPTEDIWQDAPLRVRPSQPGTGFYNIPKSGFSWQIFGGVDGRAVARNIFLDGNTFKDSHSVDKNIFVADANLGLGFTFDDVKLAYTVVYRTEEFDTQDKGQVFGALSLSKRF